MLVWSLGSVDYSAMGNINTFCMQFGICMQILLVLWISHLGPCSGEIRKTKIESDSRAMILFETFGFTPYGHVEIYVTDVTYRLAQAGADPDPGRMGFFLSTEEALVQVLIELEQNKNHCILNNNIIKLLFTFKELRADNTHNYSFPITEANEYSLFFANCHPHVQVSMNVHTKMYNMEGSKKNYLPVGQTQLPKLYFVVFWIYFIYILVWIYVCFKNKATVHRIHILMGALLFLKALNLLCEAEDKLHVKLTGSAHGWDIAFYIFNFLKGVMLFTVIVLIGTGWSFLKPFLQEREKNVLMIVIPLQVLANIANIVIDETGPSTTSWFAWKQAFLLLDIVCCLAVLLPIFWSIRNLRDASKTDGKAAKNLEKLTLFQLYYTVVICYIYFTRIVVFALTTITAYKYKWVSSGAEEFVSLAFYIFTFYKFRPIDRNPYFVLDDEEEEAVAQEAFKDEDFEL